MASICYDVDISYDIDMIFKCYGVHLLRCRYLLWYKCDITLLMLLHRSGVDRW